MNKKVKKNSAIKIFIGTTFLVLSLAVGLVLVQSRTNLAEKAQTTPLGPVSKVVTFPKAGKIRIYYADMLNPLTSVADMIFKLTGTTTQYVSFTGGVWSTAVHYVDTNISVTAGQQITFDSYYGGYLTQPSIGWRPPTTTQTCGFNGFGVNSVAAFRTYITSQAAGEPFVSEQCWGDYSPNPADTSAWDFNDYFSVVSYTPGLSPTPTPVPTATPIPAAWDVNTDGYTNIVDISLIIDDYGKSVPFNPRTDINKDGSVDILDIGIVIDHYLK